MEKKEFSDWLKKEGLSNFIDGYVTCFKSIFINNIDPFEKIIIIFDKGYPKRRASAIMAGCYMETAKQLNVDYELVLQNLKSSGDPADEKVIESRGAIKTHQERQNSHRVEPKRAKKEPKRGPEPL